MSPVNGERVTERLAGRLVALGVTGSIAAFKSVELLRLLQAEGAEVVVLLTPSAARFVAPLTLEALSRHAVETDVLALLPDGRIGHIVAADSADALVVAPATAHWLGAMANGLAADTVTATAIATTAPVVVAPAMDGDMWSHPATRANVARLRDAFGYTIVEPESGPLASGQSGVGRLAELPRIVDAVVAAVGDAPVRAADAAARPPVVEPPREPDLEGRHVVISAGGTAEPIDPVRFIGNRSTGKMGVALAQAALDRGARVTLVAANVSVALPDDALAVRVETTAQMRDAVLDLVDGADALIMAAAVADFRPRRAATKKLSRDEGLTIELEPTEDILAGASAAVRAPGARRPRPDPRRVRRRDRLPRAGRREAATEGRRPSRRERRRRGGLRLRDRHEPGHDPRGGRPRAGAAAALEAGGRGPDPRPRRGRAGRSRRRDAD